jgi:hypothetical protein
VDRITFLIGSTDILRLTCLLNPEDTQDGLTIERSSGVTREQSGSLTGSKLSDDRIVSRGRGDTRLKLKLLFDVSLAGSSIYSEDVRDLTRSFWDLSEYQALELPRVRLLWGKGWDIPVVVESVAERYERFSPDGRPQRSWLTLGLMRVNDQLPPASPPALYSATQMPTLEQLVAASDPNWGVHEKLGNGVQGDHLWQLASRYYADPRLWRLIALANDIANPLKIQAGKLLKIPPLKVLKGK